jgi:hypothetical protein
VVTVDDSEFFSIWSKTTNNPDFVDLVQSEHAERVIVFSVQEPVDIVRGKGCVHPFFLNQKVSFMCVGFSGREDGSPGEAPAA